MPDREKVIKDFESEIMNFTPACTSDELLKEVMETALELLKGQEPVEPIPPTDESDLWRCGNCNHQLFKCTHQRYCEMCGREVKWDD